MEEAAESTAEFSALEKALSQVILYSGHIDNMENPHGTTAEQVGARPGTWLPSCFEVGAVPLSRTVNGKPLSEDLMLTAADVGAMSAEGIVPISRGGTGQVTSEGARNALGLGETAEVQFGNIYQL